MSSPTLPLRRATAEEQAFSNGFLAAMPYCPNMHEHIRLTQCSEMPPVNAKGGRDVEGWEAVFEADVQPGRRFSPTRLLTADWLNGGGGLHGAAAAWLVDMTTGSAFRQLQTETWRPWGPSVAIDMSYYAPAPAWVVCWL